MNNFLTYGLYPLLATFSTMALFVIAVFVEKIDDTLRKK
jgi:hypothetical protein